MKIRAKFKCEDVVVRTDADQNKIQEQWLLRAVYSSDPNDENYSWSKYTPCGQLSMSVDNPACFGQVEQGKTYFIDIELAE